ncbi:MAG: glycosyltransferase family 4 protein [Gammaproteobacteria bacterium]|nr:glycosyltransferase family 4 protein [Gammaproteobacteria bacterium]
MGKARICAITTVAITMETFVVQMMDRLAANNYDVTLLCTMDQQFIDTHQERFSCVSISMGRGLDPIRGVLATWKMYRLFRKERFDMVQYATPNAAFYASIAAWLAHIPKRVYCQWGIRYVGCEGVSRRIFRGIEKITCRLSTDIRPASRKNLQFAVGEGLYLREKAEVVGNGGTIGVDHSHYDINQKNKWREEVRLTLNITGKTVFGFVGSVRPDKGCNELLAAFREINKHDNNFSLILIGSEFDKDPLDSELRSWALQCESVVFCGQIADTFRYIAAMDILVHPSYREGFSMVIQEAAALAIPVITTDIPGPSEVIEENVTGLLVPPKNPPALFDAMLQLGLDTILQKKMGNAGLQRNRKLFDRSIMLNKVLQDRNEIMGRAL